MKEETRMNASISRVRVSVLVLLGGSIVLSGCVLNEKYEAEKARSLNFQRLLAQEEKRTAELDNEVKRSKKELAEYETRNRELTAQVQAVREQMSRVQEESEAIKEASLLERKARSDMKRAAAPPPPPKAAPVEPPPDTVDLMGGLTAANAAASPEEQVAPPVQSESLTIPSRGSPSVHIVKPGETLYRISRKYGVRVEMLRKWNKLPDDIIEVGQKLIVSQE